MSNEIKLKEPKEILRITLNPDWSQETLVRLAGGTIKDEVILWGIVLADAVRHLNRAIEQNADAVMTAKEQKQFRHAILEIMGKELEQPDPGLEGGIIKGGPNG